MLYQVNRKEVYIQPIIIEAKNEAEAIKKVEEGEGTLMENEFEYSHTLDSTEWSIYNRNNDKTHKYRVRVTKNYTFEGFIIVEARTSKEAKQIANSKIGDLEGKMVSEADDDAILDAELIE